MGFVAWFASSGIVQGVIIGATAAFVTAFLVLDAVARANTIVTDGWRQIQGVGRPGSGILVRAAMQKALPMGNVLEEAAYWIVDRDPSGKRLSGARRYSLRFPPDLQPPNDAFWSLTATDPTGYAAGGSSVGSSSGLRENADGSVDIDLVAGSPHDERANRLVVPPGRFSLTLRVYLPGPAILSGTYRPPAVEVVS